MRRDARAAPGRGAAAGQGQLRRGVAGGQDGRIAAAGDRLPARPRGAATPSAERDLAELREFARARLGIADLQAWDMAFAAERLKEARYAFSDQEIKPYFVQGGFSTACSASSRRCSRCASAPTRRRCGTQRALLPHRAPTATPPRDRPVLPRPACPTGKRPGAWMDGTRERWLRPGRQLQTPVAHLVCNFAPPVDGRPPC